MAGSRSASAIDEARGGVDQNVGQIVADGLGVDRHPDAPRARDRQHQGQRGLAVAQHQRNAIAGPTPLLRSQAASAAASPVERPEGQGPTADRGEDALRR